MKNKIIGTRIVLRNTHPSLLDALPLAVKTIGFERKLPDCLRTGLVIYVDDDGAFDVAISPSVKENNPERTTIEVNDGNVSSFLRILEKAMKDQLRNCVSFMSDDGKRVAVRSDGTVYYGCTMVSADMVEKILAIRTNVMKTS